MEHILVKGSCDQGSIDDQVDPGDWDLQGAQYGLDLQGDQDGQDWQLSFSFLTSLRFLASSWELTHFLENILKRKIEWKAEIFSHERWTADRWEATEERRAWIKFRRLESRKVTLRRQIFPHAAHLQLFFVKRIAIEAKLFVDGPTQ